MQPTEAWTVQIKRWAPLVASVVLAATTGARVLGYDALADRMLGDAAKVTAGLASMGVAYGATRKVSNERRKRREAKEAKARAIRLGIQ